MKIVMERYIGIDGQEMEFRYFDKNGTEITVGCKVFE